MVHSILGSHSSQEVYIRNLSSELSVKTQTTYRIVTAILIKTLQAFTMLGDLSLEDDGLWNFFYSLIFFSTLFTISGLCIECTLTYPIIPPLPFPLYPFLTRCQPTFLSLRGPQHLNKFASMDISYSLFIKGYFPMTISLMIMISSHITSYNSWGSGIMCSIFHPW